MKAILVVDIPNDLKYEELYFNGEIRYTSEFDKGYVFLKEINRGLLKLLPQKENEFEKGLNEYGRGWRIGYNKCIDEILGETE